MKHWPEVLLVRAARHSFSENMHFTLSKISALHLITSSGGGGSKPVPPTRDDLNHCNALFSSSICLLNLTHTTSPVLSH